MTVKVEIEEEIKALRHDWNCALVKACRDFVKFKDDMDMANRTSYVHPEFIRKLRWLAGLYEPSERKGNCLRKPASAATPCDFTRAALPFLCPGPTEIIEYKKCLIYPQLVVSGTYNSYNHSLLGDYIDNFPDEVMDGLDNIVRNAENGTCDPKYYRHGALPLYVAIEGKNRVELFKRHREFMLTWVGIAPLIPADKLKIIRLKPFNVWAVRHDNDLCILPFSSHTLPIYRALNVAEGKPRWDFFALKKLRNARICAVSSQMRP